MEKLGRIVQIRAPHGQLDAENTDRIFSEVLPSMFESDADNVVLFEEAGVYNVDEANRFRQSLAATDSASRARYEFDLRRLPRGAPRNSYDVFGLSILCDSVDNSAQDSRKYHLHDWLLQSNPGISLTVTPESYPEAVRRRVGSQTSELLDASVIDTDMNTIEGHLADRERLWKSCVTSMQLRDPEIIKEIERVFLAPAIKKGVRTNVMIVIGGYHDPVRYLSSPFAASFHVEDRECYEFANSDGTFLKLRDADGDRDVLMRHGLYFYLASLIGEILVSDHKSTGSKKFKRDNEGKNVFGRLKDLCIGLPIEAIYKIFQFVLGIDCHVDKAAYRDVRLPAVFENFKSRQALRKFVGSAEVGMETNVSKVNLFVERKFILHYLFAGFKVANADHRKTLEAIVERLDDASVIQIATEIRSLFYRERDVGMRDKLTDLIMIVLGEARPTGIWPGLDAYCRENGEKVGALRKAYSMGNFQGYCTSRA